YGDIFINTLFINDQKTILTLTLSFSRGPLFFLSLSLSLVIFFLPLCLRFTGDPPSFSRSFFFLSASDSPEIHHLSLIPPVLCGSHCRLLLLLLVLMDLETENRIASVLLREAAELRRQAEKDGVRAYLEKPNVRHRANSRFSQQLSLVFNNAQEQENERLKRKSREESSSSSSQMKRSSSFSKRSLDKRCSSINEERKITHQSSSDKRLYLDDDDEGLGDDEN
ncbi:hypothetical protein IGI04_019373, partial [Brassica rapa subsp. trilocularis]